MLYQLKSYFKFLLASTNQHGVHSPFVYDLVTQCFYDKTKYPQYNLLKNFRKKALESNNIIEVTDFGEGSRVFSSDKRQISEIAKYAGISKPRQKLLFRLVHYFKPKNILELGTSVGLATAALSLGNESGKVISIEGCAHTAKAAQSFFDVFQLKNIELHQNTFETYFSENTLDMCDLVFIDGNHNKEHTLQYFNELLKKVTNNTVLIFDDIYWSNSMTEAWQQICLHPKVTVSIDTFHWGMVFFRVEQQKEHFIIRM